jgi:Uma2 family endonuclease
MDEATIVHRDVMIVCGETKIEYLHFTLVLIVEVFSPHNLRNERIVKFDLYRQQDVKFYIIVDCKKETVKVFELIDNIYKEVGKIP